MTAAHPRPRIVDVAFWLWLGAAVLLLLVALASELVTSESVRAHEYKAATDQQVGDFVTYYHTAGALCGVLGLAIGYIAVRTRQGDKRFRTANVALSLVTIVLLMVWEGFAGVLSPGLAATLALMAAVVLVMLPPARDWFNAVEKSPGGHGD